MVTRLTLDQLRVLIAIAETGTFSAAARRLGRVQSAISQSAQVLEASLGVSLFDRAGKTPELTEAGRSILEDARRLVRGADDIQARAESLTTEIQPHLRIAVNPVFPSEVLAASLNRIAAAFPSLSVTIFSDSLGSAEQRLHRGGADLAIYSPALAPRMKTLNTEFLAVLPVTPVVAVTHPLAAEPAPVSRSILEQHVQLIMVDAGEAAAPVAGVVGIQRNWGFSDLPTRLAFLLAGAGWGHLPMHMIEAHLAAGRLKKLDVAGQRDRFLSVSLYVAHEPGRPPDRIGRLLIDDLRVRLTRFQPTAAPVALAANSERHVS
jgi:DNA-binding transcriptional LysR family regulator